MSVLLLLALASADALAAAVPPARAYRMVALDMDGTLLNAQHQLSPESIEVLQLLDAEGILVSLCSGRSHVAMAEAVRKLALPLAPLVCFNGALGLRAMCVSSEGEPLLDDGCALFPVPPEELFHTPLEPATAQAIIEFAQQRGLLAQYYVGEKIYVVCKNEAHVKFTQRYAELTGVQAHVHLESYDEAVALGPPHKILLMSEDVDEVVSAALEALPTNLCKVVRGSPPFFVEFLQKEVNKGEGLRRLCEALGVPREEVVAFGDGDNDIEFLQQAGLGLAMRNARQVLIDVADGVTQHSNDDDGVAFELRRLLAEGKFTPQSTV